MCAVDFSLGGNKRIILKQKNSAEGIVAIPNRAKRNEVMCI